MMTNHLQGSAKTKPIRSMFGSTNTVPAPSPLGKAQHRLPEMGQSPASGRDADGERVRVGLSGLVLAEPVLEILRQDLDVLLFHDGGNGGRADFEFHHRLVDAIPEAVVPGLCVDQIQFGNKRARLLEHNGVGVLVVT